jgi:hypothetical protein
MPTLLGLAGVLDSSGHSPPTMDGRSLAPLLLAQHRRQQQQQQLQLLQPQQRARQDGDGAGGANAAASSLSSSSSSSVPSVSWRTQQLIEYRGLGDVSARA